MSGSRSCQDELQDRFTDFRSRMEKTKTREKRRETNDNTAAFNTAAFKMPLDELRPNRETSDLDSKIDPGSDSSMNGRRARHLLEYFAFRVFVCIVEALPARLTAYIGESMGTFCFRCLPRKWTRYQVAHENLRIALGDKYSDPELQQIILDMWKHLFRMIIEIILLRRKLHRQNCKQMIRFRAKEKVIRAWYSGRPVLLLSGHFGNWEMAVNCFGHFGLKMGVVARDLDNPYLDRWFRKFREQTGLSMISKKGGLDEIDALLTHGGAVALLGDQDAGRRGVFVDFFGRPASTHRAIALMALEYNAVICVGYGYRLKDRFEDGFAMHYEIGCEEVIDPLEITADNEVEEIARRYSAALERLVRRRPEQYFWVHRRWKSVPNQKRKKKQPVLKKAG